MPPPAVEKWPHLAMRVIRLAVRSVNLARGWLDVNLDRRHPHVRVRCTVEDEKGVVTEWLHPGGKRHERLLQQRRASVPAGSVVRQAVSIKVTNEQKNVPG